MDFTESNEIHAVGLARASSSFLKVFIAPMEAKLGGICVRSEMGPSIALNAAPTLSFQMILRYGLEPSFPLHSRTTVLAPLSSPVNILFYIEGVKWFVCELNLLF